jgi:hypothetical protein
LIILTLSKVNDILVPNSLLNCPFQKALLSPTQVRIHLDVVKAHPFGKTILKMVVDAMLSLDLDELDESLIGVKKTAGGGMQDSLLIRGVSFKKTFTYAGAEQQPKSFTDPLILSLIVELEKDNAKSVWMPLPIIRRSWMRSGRSSTASYKKSKRRARRSC